MLTLDGDGNGEVDFDEFLKVSLVLARVKVASKASSGSFF